MVLYTSKKQTRLLVSMRVKKFINQRKRAKEGGLNVPMRLVKHNSWALFAYKCLYKKVEEKLVNPNLCEMDCQKNYEIL